MHSGLVVLALLLNASLVACTGEVSSESPPVATSADTGNLLRSTIADRGPVERVMLPVQWRPVWRRGGQGEEDMFAVVAAVLPHESGVVIADAGALELQAFDAATGRRAWQVGRKGSGPGEFRNISDITRDSAGNTIAIDGIVGRITTISPAGDLLPYRSNQMLQFAQAICTLRDGSIAAVLSRPDVWVVVVRDSQIDRSYSFPAPIPRGAPDFVRSTYFARGESANTCPLFTLFGYGIGSVRSDSQALELQPHIETLVKPEFDVRQEQNGPTPITTATLKRGTTITSRGSVWRDTVVLSMPEGDARGESMLDLFDTSGRYLGTWPFPDPGIEFGVYANGMLYTLSSSTVAPQITAWRRVNDNVN